MNINTPVKEIMTTSPVSLHPEDSLNIVDKTFASYPFHHIPIVDVNQSIQGMVSKTDLLQLSAIKQDLSERDFTYLKVKDFMSRNLVVVDPGTTVLDAARLFQANSFHALPVIEDGKVAGIVTTHDLIEFAFELKAAMMP